MNDPQEEQITVSPNYVLIGRKFIINKNEEEDDCKYPTNSPETTHKVFFDRLRGWSIEPAKKLLEDGKGHIAAIQIVTPLIEAYHIYSTGKTGRDTSRDGKWFKEGVSKIFLKTHGEAKNALYESVRCGLAHTGFLGAPKSDWDVFVSAGVANPLTVNLQVKTLTISPSMYVNAIADAYKEFEDKLAKGDVNLTKCFGDAWTEQWSLCKRPKLSISK